MRCGKVRICWSSLFNSHVFLRGEPMQAGDLVQPISSDPHRLPRLSHSDHSLGRCLQTSLLGWSLLSAYIFIWKHNCHIHTQVTVIWHFWKHNEEEKTIFFISGPCRKPYVVLPPHKLSCSSSLIMAVSSSFFFFPSFCWVVGVDCLTRPASQSRSALYHFDFVVLFFNQCLYKQVFNTQ